MGDLKQEKQAESLIRKMDAEADREIAGIISEAEAQAKDIVRRAYRTAREQLHIEVEKVRQTESREILKERARIDTLKRQQNQVENLEAIGTAWPMLKQALVRQWAEENERSDWIRNSINAAVTRLNKGRLRIDHPLIWSEADRDIVSGEIEARGGMEPPEFVLDKSLEGGLRIWADKACLDASITAILSDRETIESLFLNALAKEETP